MLAPLLTGFLWGLAESTFFFIVPDVLLCFWMIRSVRSAAVSTIAAVVGALTGAGILYFLLNRLWMTPEDFYQVWSLLPGFKMKMAEVAHQHVAAGGAQGLLSGPSSGIPYRVYVVESWRVHVPFLDVLLWTPLARLERILIPPFLTWVVRSLLKRGVAPRFPTVKPSVWNNTIVLLTACYWICIYAWYWGIMVPRVYG